MKRTFQPSNKVRKARSGFRNRNQKVLNNRRKKGRRRLSA